MATLIIYAVDDQLERTLAGIADTVPPSQLDEIFVVDDSGTEAVSTSEQYHLLRSPGRAGRAACWNLAAKVARGEHLVFLPQVVKFGDDWLLELLEMAAPKRIVGSAIADLNSENWFLLPPIRQRFGWRWDLSLYGKSPISAPDFSPTVGECFLIPRRFFEALGGFDGIMRLGRGETLDLTIRAWLCGGDVVVADKSLVGVPAEFEEFDSRFNLDRIAERWLGKYARHYYDMAGTEPHDVGKLGRLPKLVNDIEWFISTKQPELAKLYGLRGSAIGQSVAIVGSGPSLDLVQPSAFGRYDIVIGADYGGLLAKCDYVISTDFNIIKSLLSAYEGERLLLPASIIGATGGRICDAAELHPQAIPFELAVRGEVQSQVHPPFCNFDSAVPCAVQLALFMGAREITLLGCDNRLLGGRSHSAKLTLTDGGRYLPDNEITAKKFEYEEYALAQLAKLAFGLGVPLLRLSHV